MRIIEVEGQRRTVPEEVRCNLCGGASSRTLYTLKDYRLFVDDAAWPIVQCRECGLGYLNPRPTRSEIGRYYPADYFTHRERLGKRYGREAAYVEGPPGRLLDIGAAGGDFLAVMKERGWDVEGIEPFRQATNPHGLPIHRMSFPEDSTLPDERFDVITAWAVFEHLHDPKRAFAESVRLLKPDGRLIIEVPNFRSIRARIARMEDVPRHLYFFSPATLRRYGDEAGLQLTFLKHVTDLFSGASGREAARYWVARALGKSADDFYRIYRARSKERFRTWPLTASAMTAAGVSARLLVPDWLVRAARLSGEVVAIYRKP
jgi:SAM-dependent methyltransferase